MNIQKLLVFTCLLALAACSSPKKCYMKDNECCVIGESCDFVNCAGDKVFFDFDKAELTSDAKCSLDKQIKWLQKYCRKNILIEGHCDERGTREYNLGLGEKRAKAVADYLIANGIAENRIRIVSYGKDKPIELPEGSTKEEIWKANRVAISVIE